MEAQLYIDQRTEIKEQLPKRNFETMRLKEKLKFKVHPCQRYWTLAKRKRFIKILMLNVLINDCMHFDELNL